MTPLGLAWRRLVRRPAATALNLLLIALGVATIATMVLVLGQTSRAAERNAAAADLVVGANTSAMQLVLAGIFHLDVAPAPLELDRIHTVLGHKLIERWVPLALGDSLQGYRVAGTQPQDFVDLYGGALQHGDWPGGQAQALLGADVAEQTRLQVGETFVTSHGMAHGAAAHEHYPYRVSGVLAHTGTVLDKLIVTPIESVWQAHAPAARPSGVSAANDATGKASMVLITLRSPLGAVMLPRLFESAGGYQVAVPAREAAKLFSLVRIGAEGTLMLGIVLLACAALAVCAGLMASAQERMRDMAVLRLLGASRLTTTGIVFLEATLLGLVGGVVGLAVAHGVVAAIGQWLPQAGPSLSGSIVEPVEFWILGGAVLVAWVGAALPAWRVQRAVVPDVLKTA